MSETPKAIVDRLTPGMVERESETIEKWIDEAIAHGQELMECGHPRACLIADALEPYRVKPKGPTECLACEAIAKARADTADEFYRASGVEMTGCDVAGKPWSPADLIAAVKASAREDEVAIEKRVRGALAWMRDREYPADNVIDWVFDEIQRLRGEK